MNLSPVAFKERYEIIKEVPTRKGLDFVMILKDKTDNSNNNYAVMTSVGFYDGYNKKCAEATFKQFTN